MNRSRTTGVALSSLIRPPPRSDALFVLVRLGLCRLYSFGANPAANRFLARYAHPFRPRGIRGGGSNRTEAENAYLPGRSDRSSKPPARARGADQTLARL